MPKTLMEVYVIIVFPNDRDVRFKIDVELVAGLIPLLKSGLEKKLIKYFNISM